MHDHNHHDGHHHHHGPIAPGQVNRAFIAGIVINMLFVVIQAIVGFRTNSVALLSDAGHNLSDVAGLVISLIAFRLARTRPTPAFTYGYKKTTILAALVNAVVLMAAIFLLAYEAIHRLQHPHPVQGGIVAAVAGIGIAVNAGSALFFLRSKEHELNTKSAYLHLMADAAVSLAVVIAGLVIKYTGWYWLDGAASLLILAVVLYSTWSLLSDSVRMTLDAVPSNVSTDEIERLVLATKGVTGMHHTHIWAMSTTENALTTHITMKDSLSFDQKVALVQEIKHMLSHHHIHHATIELESDNCHCPDEEC